MQSKKRQMLTCAFDTKAQAPLRHRVYLVKLKKTIIQTKKPKVLLVVTKIPIQKVAIIML